MDLTAIRSRVRTVIRDSNSAFISDSEIDEWANEAQLEIATRLRLLHEEDTEGELTETDNYITLPANFLEPISLRFGTDDAEFVDDWVWESHSDAGSTPDHPLARIFNGRLEVYPTPSTWDYVLRYYRKPTSLTTGSSTPEIPEQMHIKLVHYVRAHALIAMGEMQQADAYMNLFEQGMPNRRGDERIWMAGPLSITLAPGPFDWDPDSTHR